MKYLTCISAILFLIMLQNPARAAKNVLNLKVIEGKKLGIIVNPIEGRCKMVTADIDITLIKPAYWGSWSNAKGDLKGGKELFEALGDFSIENFIALNTADYLNKQLPGSIWEGVPIAKIPFIKVRNTPGGFEETRADYARLGSEGNFDYLLDLTIHEYGILDNNAYFVVSGFFMDVKTKQKVQEFYFLPVIEFYRKNNTTKEEWLAENARLFREEMEKATILFAKWVAWSLRIR